MDVTEHMGLSWMVAKSFVRHHPHLRNHWDDLISVGYLALVEAESRYKQARGKFSTYAVRCIFNQMADYARTQGQAGAVFPQVTFRQLKILQEWVQANHVLPSRETCEQILGLKVIQGWRYKHLMHALELAMSQRTDDELEAPQRCHCVSGEDGEMILEPHEMDEEIPHCMACGWQVGGVYRTWHPPRVVTAQIIAVPDMEHDRRNLVRLCAGCYTVSKGGYAVHNHRPLPKLNLHHMLWCKNQEDPRAYDRRWLVDLYLDVHKKSVLCGKKLPQVYRLMFLENQGRFHGSGSSVAMAS